MTSYYSIVVYPLSMSQKLPKELVFGTIISSPEHQLIAGLLILCPFFYIPNFITPQQNIPTKTSPPFLLPIICLPFNLTQKYFILRASETIKSYMVLSEGNKRFFTVSFEIKRGVHLNSCCTILSVITMKRLFILPGFQRQTNVRGTLLVTSPI